MSGDRWIIGITGASGTVYARRLLQALVTHVPGVRLDVVVSSSALRVMRDEEGLAVGPLTAEMLLGFASQAVSLVVDGPHRQRSPGSAPDDDRNGDGPAAQPVKRLPVTLHPYRDIGASIASGSCPTRGMVVVPCSMKTLAGIAHGYGENLIARAADVVLKERRRLILVPRETPLSAIHLKNMLSLARLGVAIVPAMPGFYHRPATIDDLVGMMVMRILDQMGYEIDLAPRWTSDAAKPQASPKPSPGAARG